MGLHIAREGPARGGPAAEAVPAGDVAVGARGVDPAVGGGDGERVPGDAVAGDEDALEEMRRLALLPGLDAAVGGARVDDAGAGGDGVDGVVVGADVLEAFLVTVTGNRKLTHHSSKQKTPFPNGNR